MEEEAQKLAQAMMPMIEASTLTNGQSSRKLHRDNDVVRNVSEELERNSGPHSNDSGRSSGCSSGGSGGASGGSDRIDSSNDSHQY